MKCFMTHQDCIYEKDIQERRSSRDRTSLFVISPFGFPYDDIFRNIIARMGKEAGIDVWRADRAYQTGFVMCTKICRPMQEAKYVLADLTEDNPNVFYELGLAWGFSQKIVIMRDPGVRMSRGAREILDDSMREKILSHEQLREIRKEPAKLAGLLNDKAIDASGNNKMESNRQQRAYIRNRQIGVCYRDRQPDAKFYLGMVEEAARDVANKNTKKDQGEKDPTRGKTDDRSNEIRNEEIPQDQNKSKKDAENNASPMHWKMEQVPIGPEKLSGFLPDKLASSKVVIVDTTHYDKKADTSMYFALGLSHAMGRETIPITNRARYDDASPFDVHGLWQVYFKNLRELKKELGGILNVISPDYEKERRDYPLRFIWDKVLRRNGGVSIFGCARGTGTEDDRAGGRTHVDKWDYSSVAELAGFIGKKYKQARINIVQPKEKEKTETLREEPGRTIRQDEFEATLRKSEDNLIIVGSPDVNDYTEIALARIYGVTPYQREDCKQVNPALQRKCWQCKLKHQPECIGKRGYLFYKRTIDEENPRKVSDFFRDPPRGEQECVLWRGAVCPCIDNSKMFGVLTILKDRKRYLARDDDVDRWIILLSGFSGVATYALAKVLTTIEVKMRDGESEKLLQEVLEEKGIDLDKRGVHVLVSVNYYTSDLANKNTDSRQPAGSVIHAIMPLPKDLPSEQSPQRIALIEPFLISPG